MNLGVCLVQAYRAPDYIRGAALKAALASNDAVGLSMAMNRSSGLLRYLEAIRGLLRARRLTDPQVYVLAFRGHEIAWLVRRVIGKRPLVFDAMMSPYASMTEETSLGGAGRLLAPLWYLYERAILKRADLVLTDTELHARYYQTTFGIPAKRLLAVPVGAIEAVGERAPVPGSGAASSEPQPFRILFYGSFLPLHGIDIIIEAASRLTDLPIAFDFVGGTARQARRLTRACAQRGIRHSHRAWVAFDVLVSKEIPHADLCLGGPFGGTPQALRVVTGKTSQCLALGKATVVGRIDEDFGFIDKSNCLLVEQHDAAALADSIRWAYMHRESLPGIGRSGQALYRERLSVEAIAKRLVPALHALASSMDGNET